MAIYKLYLICMEIRIYSYMCIHIKCAYVHIYNYTYRYAHV